MKFKKISHSKAKQCLTKPNLIECFCLKRWVKPLFLMSALSCMSGLGLTGCVTQAKLANNTPISSTQVSENLAEKPLTAEFVYQYLIAEIAGQRGDFSTSGSIFYQLAKTEQDARFAERAAKVAAYGNIGNLVFPSVQLWAELDPSSTEAQQAMTEILIKADKLEEAEPYLSQLLAKENTRASGFIFINSLLNKSTNKPAVLALTQSLAEPYPTLAEAHFSIAQAAIAANQNDLAFEEINTAEKLKPGWNLAAILKGQLLFTQSPQKAIDYYQNFVKKYPNTNEVRLNLAKMLVNQKQYALAKKQFPIILEQANKEKNTHAHADSTKNMADITALIGLLSLQAEDYPAAKSYFEDALALNFKDPEQLYLYLGQVAEKQKEDALALNWYSKIEQGNHFFDAQLNTANLIARTKNADEAIKYLDEVNDLSTEQQVIVIQTQASMLAKAKRNQESFELLDKAVKNMPNTPDIVYDYALSAERVLKFDVMEKELRRVIAEKPDFAAAYNALGYSFADRNIKLDEALNLIQKALEISPNDHYMLDSLGWVYYKKGDLDQAIGYLQQAFKINPDPEIAAHLGEVLWQKGQHDAAKKIWDDALIADPTNEVLLNTHKKFTS